ncbi:O-antigen polymerase [Streptococcus mitis]|uniref:Oligosaccharide repeat unit polymerase n=1 Tax=Streptococcus mitis TaxID=28037 RepID=A0A1X1JZA4_STRMT|nr:O-antigen polymerase [Streptococcus mitis]ORO92419.1 hypothetical protein B7699_07780 [Streptococcus mitis]
MLYFSFIMSLFLFFINFNLTQREYLHPSNIYYVIFVVTQFFCILGQEYYGISFNGGTVFIILSTMIVFTVISLLSRKILMPNARIISLNPNVIEFNFWLKAIVLVIQIVTIFYFYNFINRLFIAGNGYSGSLPELINYYDQILKFNSIRGRELNISVAKIYYYLKAFTDASSYIALYLLIKKYLVSKVVDRFFLLIVANYSFFLLLQGSRSPLFRLITSAMILWYFLYFYINDRKLNIKFIMKIINLMLLIVPFSILFLFLTGRNGDGGQIDLLQYLYIYIGAPLLNLNNFISSAYNSLPLSHFFGEQTFYGAHAIIQKLFGNYSSAIEYIVGSGSWQNASNGLSTGNVLTTYYPVVYDFGILGVLPISIIFSLYYILTYDRLLLIKSNKIIDFRLFLYSYLINDLVMLIFSNRFFETILSIEFIRFYILAAVIIYLLNRSYKGIENK